MRGKRRFLGIFLGLVGVLAAAQLSFGAGFALYEGSARGLALGGTLVGRADDPSALFYNPAGITQLPGLQMMMGATAITPSSDVVIGGKSYGTEDNVYLPPHLYATYQYSDKVWFGLGIFSPFGLGTEFDENWPGNLNSYKAVIESVTVNPNVALKLNDQFSIAAGMEIMWFDLELKRKLVGGAVDFQLTGDSWGYGFNGGIRYQPCKYAALGVSYRSQVKQAVDGKAKFNPQVPGFTLVDSNAGGDVTLPDHVFMGLALYPMDRLSVEIGTTWIRWSTYDQLTIVRHLDTGDVATTSVKEWNDVWRINFGVEYKLYDWLDLRAGYIYDQEPVSNAHADYLLPANDRHLFSVGPGFRWGKWTLDLSYTYDYITDRDYAARPADFIPASKAENSQAHLFGLSVGYKF